MRIILFTVALLIMSSVFVTAQTSIKMPYSKSIELSNGKWGKWPSKWESEKKLNNYVPTLYIKKIDSEIYELQLDQGGSGVFKENVIYDPVKTKEIRKSTSNESLSAYRYTGSKDYLWTDNVSLKMISSKSSSWTSVPNAKIYIWNTSMGSATLYAPSIPKSTPAVQKYKVNFKATKKLIKGTWTNWSSWKTVPSNSYFELKIIREKREYNLKYYEKDKIVKDFNITYDSKKTKEIQEKTKNASAYSINGQTNQWVYLQNTSMSSIFNNPDKWSNENNAVIQIVDYKKSGNQTQIK